MAREWLKVELALPEKPEVIGIAAILGINEDEVVGKLIRLWRWCDQQLVTCHAPSVTLSFLDRYVGMPGFGQAMVDVGWLIVKKSGLEIPKYDRHLSQGSKARALAADRKRSQRDSNETNVTGMSRSKRDNSVTRRREEGEVEEEVKEDSEVEGNGARPPTPQGGAKESGKPYVTKEDQEVGRKMVDAWNGACGVHPQLDKCHMLSAKRLWLIRKACDESPQFEGLFYQALAKLPITRDINGWQPSFDWMIEDVTNAVKVIEGQYDDKQTPKARVRDKKPSMGALLEGMLDGDAS